MDATTPPPIVAPAPPVQGDAAGPALPVLPAAPSAEAPAAPAPAPASASASAPAPAPAPAAPAAPPAAWTIAPPTNPFGERPPPPRRALELGAAAFLFSGGGVGSYAGVAPFLVAEMGQDILLRPSLAFGQATGTALRSTWGGARVDTCLRLAGLYSTGNGIQLDLCGGVEAGVSYVASGTQSGAPSSGQTLPYIALGPSVDLRAELGTAAVTLRGVVGYDLAGESYTDASGNQLYAPPVPVRLEVGFSWDLHAQPQPQGPAEIAQAVER